MIYNAKVAVCFEIRTKYSTQSENHIEFFNINPINAELNPISHLLALLGAHHIFHVSGLRVKPGGTSRKL